MSGSCSIIPKIEQPNKVLITALTWLQWPTRPAVMTHLQKRVHQPRWPPRSWPIRDFSITRNGKSQVPTSREPWGFQGETNSWRDHTMDFMTWHHHTTQRRQPLELQYSGNSLFLGFKATNFEKTNFYKNRHITRPWTELGRRFWCKKHHILTP